MCYSLILQMILLWIIRIYIGYFKCYIINVAGLIFNSEILCVCVYIHVLQYYSAKNKTREYGIKK